MDFFRTTLLVLSVVSGIFALSTETLSASKIKKLNGTWTGLLLSPKNPLGIPIAVRIKNGKATEYVWDGKNVKIRSSSKTDNNGIHIRGRDLSVIIESLDDSRAKLRTTDWSLIAFLDRNSEAPGLRRPVYFDEMYGEELPKTVNSEPRVISTYRSFLGNFKSFKRKAPHAGVDFEGSRHTKAIASADGKVVKIFSAYNSYGCGNGIAIRFANRLFYTYCHLETVKRLKIGDVVKRGDFLGTVGSTGNASRFFPHIHFEVVTDGIPHEDGDTKNTKNPADFLIGCYRPGHKYENNRLLTYPVPCFNESNKAKPTGLLTMRDLQRKLLTIGYKIGKPDGVIGAKTNTAIQDFLEKYNLDQDTRSFEEQLLLLANGGS